ncbi:MAG TPA: MBL fold metallo-hydrolase [Spirochaetota bacterium]|nr:MBL fold metallo-hydrolase [Spirochaetota bacterium]
MTEILPIPFNGLCGNCCLLKNGDNYVLVDTALRSKRRRLEEKLDEHGCTPGKLKLIVLTHGDFDHSGNAHYLRSKYDCPIGMHPADEIITEKGNMFLNKNKQNKVLDLLTRKFMNIDTFTPDVYLEDNADLNDYGIDAKIIHLPGHSAGSIGVLTAKHQLICGDLFENRRKPGLYFPDDKDGVARSIEKLRHQNILEIYPGHGKKFLFSELKDIFNN